MSDGTAADGFAAFLRQLKDRSGLSYGVLAKRLHMSTSTLHRYCNGDAVPTDYAPVERLARLCKASPAELVELHRRWVLADAARGSRKGAADAAAAEAVAEGAAETARAGGTAGVSGASEEAPGDMPEDLPGDAPGPARPQQSRRLRRRTALLAGVAVAAVLGAVAFAVQPFSGDQGDVGRRSPVGAAASSGGVSATPTKASPAPTAKETESGGKSTPSVSPSVSRTSGGAGGAPVGEDPGNDAGPLLTVTTRPYTWEGPCSQHYLIDRPAAEVHPPPFEQGAPAWVSAEGAVSAGQQLVTLTVQGTGERTVVLESLAVHVVGRGMPLAWNDYVMGVGCGGDVPTHPFTVALDAARPVVQPAAGQRDFPFSVSESDPEVFRVMADASAYDVRWYLELKWSSGTRQGTVVVDDGGEPFRTSGNNGRPSYEFPLGGEKWVESAGDGA
ncbi:helix-turn-helix transcriptional regulator [Streptomyces sp. DG2A-72]|uniref:helix-turn-helix domain-containing protein n=1 Tax=Streptomyces sp. DG2A-72 TaxID=3051386 RepID=UPI00265C13C1|nr:helix-turn-helix transcriptional regulator [Streptomyces sp. DG2A-72]MDO0935383.1 helix-turn-helix transcriptional regulator [Streptomyces sp. DG2A-72]